MTRVKICGITRIEDAVVASDLGAYAIGFILWPGSKRFVEPQHARVIGDALPAGVLKVGVFVDPPLDEVRQAAADANLDVVQLHGDETVDYAAAVGRPVFKAVPVTAAFDPGALEDLPSGITVLLDAHDPVKRGGTGQTIDWGVAAAVSARRPVILSGGLAPENVHEAIATVRPFAIDLSSGVESSPGIKDHARLAALFEAIRHD